RLRKDARELVPSNPASRQGSLCDPEDSAAAASIPGGRIQSEAVAPDDVGVAGGARGIGSSDDHFWRIVARLVADEAHAAPGILVHRRAEQAAPPVGERDGAPRR